MNRIYTKILLCVLTFILFAVVAYRVTAVGTYINELPIKTSPSLGVYHISCGYHTECDATAGFGLDWVHHTQSSKGKTVYASGKGTVYLNTAHPSWGISVIIDHPNDYRSRYAHLLWYFPRPNQSMRGGSPIGYIGNTGCEPCGNHLHWQVYNNNQDSGAGVEPVPVDGYTSFVQYNPQTGSPTYENSGFTTYMRLVDNTDPSPAFTLTGTASCFNNTLNGYHQVGLEQSVPYFRYCLGSGGISTGKWTPTPGLPFSGNTHVYAFIPAHSGLTLTGQAAYKIYSNNSLVQTVMINQHFTSNKWVNLGYFNLSTSGTYVTLASNAGDGQRVAFDAMMFIPDLAQ